MSDQDIIKQEVNGQETNTIEPAAEEKTVMDFPAEWLRIANRPDGSRKATIMYYVDFSPLFTDGEKMLKKIRDVLHVFEENRDQATVVWHQDRLIDKYLKNDAPETWKHYRELVDGFAAAGYGILDDTAEGDEEYFRQIRENYPGPAPTPGEQQAMEFCDAFYGDGGYLANCFRNAGKPVMLQNADILSDEG